MFGGLFCTLALTFMVPIAVTSSSEHVLTRRTASPMTTVLPVSYSIGTSPALDGLLSYQGTITLSPTNPLLTLDYGSEVLGIPVLAISALSGPTQIELKYTEEFAGLNSIYGDGPWTFANGLSNSFRTETFEITELGTVQSFLLQGGLRWQSIELLTNTTVTFADVGLQTNKPIIPNDQLPGFFNASNDLYSQIWGLGAKAVQAACVDAGSLASTWEITDDGALIRGQESAQSVAGKAMSNYTMTFLSKIVRGGTGWRVASSIRPYGPYFVLTSNYPSASTFVNADTSLVPPNTLIAGYGWNLVNQTTLPTGPVEQYALNMSILENAWYEISTTIASDGFEISVNGTTIATISYAEGISWSSALFGPSSITTGTWGFGPFQDQIAYVKDVSVTTVNGTLLYQNPMTSEDILVEYGVVSNESVCLDGSKRDRLVWIGDFVHTARTVAASTNRIDFITGVFDYEFARQIDSGNTHIGYVPTAGAMGASAANKAAYYSSSYSITDYQIFFLVTIGDYYNLTGDLTTINKYWTQTKLLAEAMLGLVDPYSGLMAGEGSNYFTGTVNGTAPSALMVIALRQLTTIASAIGDANTATAYKTFADNLSIAINSLLWNDEIGTYSLSLAAPSNFSAASIAFAIRGGVANKTQAASSIAQLPLLKYGCGYLTSNSAPGTNTTQLSPNILGFLLESLFIANTTMGIQDLDIAKDLLDNFWSPMVTQNEYYTGASWEYLYPDGSPGIDLFTSLSHPWGSAPTYVFEQYVLGIRALEAGYKRWQFQPLIHGLELSDVEGVVPTPYGTISASWRFVQGQLVLNIEGPEGTTGILNLPFLSGNSTIDGQMVEAMGRDVVVEGGVKTEITITL